MKRRTLTRALLASSLALLASLGGGTAHAQAEAAPESYEPPAGVPMSPSESTIEAEQEASLRRWVVQVQPRLVIALGNGGGSGLPRIGFGAGASAGRAIFVHGRTRLGLGFSFSYERQQQEVRVGPSFQPGDTTQYLSHAAFSVDLRLDGMTFRGRIRPWVMIGPAVSVASYSAPPTVDPQNPTAQVDLTQRTAATVVLPALRAAIGLGVLVSRAIEVGLRAEWLATFSSATVGAGAQQVQPFSPGNFSIGIDVGFRF